MCRCKSCPTSSPGLMARRSTPIRSKPPEETMRTVHRPDAISRRDLLRRTGAGFAFLGLAGTLQSALAGHEFDLLPARARRIIFLFMNGGPSHVDTFDPKPALAK